MFAGILHFGNFGNYSCLLMSLEVLEIVVIIVIVEVVQQCFNSEFKSALNNILSSIQWKSYLRLLICNSSLLLLHLHFLFKP